ncbi:MAG: signal peptidase I [Pseudomonadota bacterium]
MSENIEKENPDQDKVQPIALAATPRPSDKKPTKEAQLVEKEDMGEFFKTALIAIALALIIRSLFYEPFNIPSSSMKPTLLVGDYLFVSKPAYGYSKYSFPLSNFVPIDGRVLFNEPERGDVIVFKLPSNPSIDYIKRIVALPGERVRVQNGRLFINGEMVDREPVGLKQVDKDYGRDVQMMEYIETLPGGVMHRIYEETDNGELDNTAEYIVPPKHYFVMGDNRDNSQDSRVSGLVGTIPYENIVGRASMLFFSVDDTADLYNPLTWPGSIRYGRIFDTLSPIRPEDPQQ